MKYWYARKNWQIKMWYHMELMATTSTHPPTTKTGGSLRQGKYWTVTTTRKYRNDAQCIVWAKLVWAICGCFSISFFPVFYFLFLFIYFILFYFILFNTNLCLLYMEVVVYIIVLDSDDEEEGPRRCQTRHSGPGCAHFFFFFFFIFIYTNYWFVGSNTEIPYRIRYDDERS